MGAKEKLLGIIVIVAGAFPLLMGVKSISDSLNKYSFVSYLTAGGYIYQAIIIVIGILLLYSPRPRAPRYAYPPPKR
jgi:hypothetical protein